MCDRKRSQSADRFLFVSKETSKSKLRYPDLAQFPSVEYLNLHDSEYRINKFLSVPSFHEYLDLTELSQNCCEETYVAYNGAVKKILFQTGCDREDLPKLIRKFLYVVDLFGINLKESVALDNYFKFAFKMQEKTCDDPHTMQLLWERLCVTSTNKIRVLTHLIREECEDNKHEVRRCSRLLWYTLKAANSVHFDLWGSLTSDRSQLELHEYTCCPVTAALLTGSARQLSILLQFGFEPNCQRLCNYDLHFYLLFSFVTDSTYEALRLPLVDKIYSRKTEIYEVLIFLYSLWKCMNEATRNAMIYCFRLVWSILPSPLVTLDELKNECFELCRLPEISVTEAQMEEFLMLYSNIFSFDGYPPLTGCDSSIRTLQPRSLSYLSRCAIRRQLKKCFMLPYGILDLKLPARYESYLQVNRIQL